MKEWLSEDKIQLIGADSMRVELTSGEMLNKMLGQFIEEKIIVIDIMKDNMDIETVYQEVYGD